MSERNAKDAARYRWLVWAAVRTKADDYEPKWADDLLIDFFRGRWVHPDDLGAAIDAVMAEESRWSITDAGRAALGKGR